jgi:hypothetical protein
MLTLQHFSPVLTSADREEPLRRLMLLFCQSFRNVCAWHSLSR